MSSEELSFREWLPKITEKLMFFNISIKEKIDKISEDDWDLIMAMHSAWYKGLLPSYYKSKPDMTVETTTEPELFSDNLSSTLDGTDVVIGKTEIKTKKPCIEEEE